MSLSFKKTDSFSKGAYTFTSFNQWNASSRPTVKYYWFVVFECSKVVTRFIKDPAWNTTNQQTCIDDKEIDYIYIIYLFKN